MKLPPKSTGKVIFEEQDWHKDASGRLRFSRDGLYFYSMDEWQEWQEWKHFCEWQGKLIRYECSFIEFAQALLDADYQYSKPHYWVHEDQLEETA